MLFFFCSFFPLSLPLHLQCILGRPVSSRTAQERAVLTYLHLNQISRQVFAWIPRRLMLEQLAPPDLSTAEVPRGPRAACACHCQSMDQGCCDPCLPVPPVKVGWDSQMTLTSQKRLARSAFSSKTQVRGRFGKSACVKRRQGEQRLEVLRAAASAREYVLVRCRTA